MAASVMCNVIVKFQLLLGANLKWCFSNKKASLGTKTCDIERKSGFSSATLADWRHFVHEQVLDHVELTSSKIGGVGKVVEVDESKFGKRKFHKGRHVEGQWVFGGVERDSGKLFLVAVHDRTQRTLMQIIMEWIEPGTTIISDCWKGYNHDVLTAEGFNHLTVNHSLNFVDPDTGAHTNTIESTWRHVKSRYPQYNRQNDASFYLAKCLKKVAVLKTLICSMRLLK
ncbi:DDE_Tnp_IS1595 domain-containing protein [Trichonephila clavipes]|nr:DDE_Tnp_IS1595 domain-containing protein [Trichonephila clavipes]